METWLFTVRFYKLFASVFFRLKCRLLSDAAGKKVSLKEKIHAKKMLKYYLLSV